ncbi:MAG: hypothetical protein IKU09_03375 [Firmicutes bacterium]|nr:hypothetical protein [Bacillota bacterium]
MCAPVLFSFLFQFHQFIEDFLHPLIQRSADFCTGFQFHINSGRILLALLIAQIVFQAGPKVHSHGTDLHFYRNFLSAIQQEYGYGNYQMQASVTIWFRIFYVILLGNQFHIVHSDKHFCQCVDIVYKIADNPDTGNVKNIISCVFDGNFLTQTFQLFFDTCRDFQTPFHMMNRIVVMAYSKIFTENLNLGADFFNRRSVSVTEDLEPLLLLNTVCFYRHYYEPHLKHFTKPL